MTDPPPSSARCEACERLAVAKLMDYPEHHALIASLRKERDEHHKHCEFLDAERWKAMRERDEAREALRKFVEWEDGLGSFKSLGVILKEARRVLSKAEER
jgi:hypothetical protein